MYKHREIHQKEKKMHIKQANIYRQPIKAKWIKKTALTDLAGVGDSFCQA